MEMTSNATKLYLVRHGETDYNRQHIVQGQGVNSQLNAQGLHQASLLRDRMAAVELDAIYSSSLDRAVQTASVVAEGHPGLSVVPEAGIEEMSFGSLEGKPLVGDTLAFFKQIWKEWANSEFDKALPEGESVIDVRDRGVAALKRIAARHVGETVLVVTHGRFLRIVLSSILPDKRLERMNEVEHANTGINRLISENGSFHADLLNCTEHLDTVGERT